jgi:hypothetical protein
MEHWKCRRCCDPIESDRRADNNIVCARCEKNPILPLRIEGDVNAEEFCIQFYDNDDGWLHHTIITKDREWCFAFIDKQSEPERYRVARLIAELR